MGIKTPEGTLYQGTPSEIVINMAEELADCLKNADIKPDGLHVIALIHLACSISRMIAANPEAGKAPSFGVMLSCLSRGMGDGKWSVEEYQAFDREFGEMVIALGGSKIGSKELGSGLTVKDGKIIMSPSLGVH